MLPVALGLIAAFSLLVWWAWAASKPFPPTKIVRDDTYRRDRDEQRCFDCGGPLGFYYNVLKCDRCLQASINRNDLGETGEVDGAMSVAELEKLWTLK